MKKIIFEDNNILVIRFYCESHKWVITFGDALNLSMGDSFFADKFISKSAINAIGYMAKSPNWYPKSSIINSYQTVSNHLLDSSNIVIYGGSMGGYAALKYSKLFNAKSVIALCPQWSIDPKECTDFEPGFSNFYTQSMAGMSIKEEDISGDVFIFSDPQLAQDTAHRNKIIEIYPSATPINVYSADHNVTGVIAGSNNIENIFSACENKNISQLIIAVSNARKNSISRIYTLLNRLSNRHPIIFTKLVLSKLALVPDGIYFDIASEYYLKIFQILSIRKELSLLNLWCNVSPKSQKVWFMQSLLIKRNSMDGSVYLKTHHGTVIAFNLLKTQLCHLRLESLLEDHSLYCKINFELHEDKINFCLDIPGMRVNISSISSDGSIGLSHVSKSIDNQLPRNFKYLELEHNKIAICSNEFYLSADESGAIKFNKEHCFNWEWFNFTYL